MNRPVIIVDPRSSGTELAPTFQKKGIPAIAVTLKSHQDHLGFGTQINEADFIDVIAEQQNLEKILAKVNPLAILPGAEGGVPLANRLSQALTPHFANAADRSLSRIHKFHMQKALVDEGVPALKTIHTGSMTEVEHWLKDNDLSRSPLIVKPPISAGSEKVFHVQVGQDWRKAFQDIVTSRSFITGQTNETAVVQEQAVGTEFSVGTVSANGKHYLAHLIKYNKISFNGRQTVYDHVEFIPLEDQYKEIFAYTQQVLDALGVKWGAAHNEIMLTSDGPRLIESVPRMTGGPVVHFAREATGSSQADKLVEIFAHGDVQTKAYQFKKSVVPVFLKSPTRGVVSNVQALQEIQSLQTLFRPFLWFKEGDTVPQTVDYLTSIGIIALSGDRKAIFSDYQKIRAMEAQLQFM